MGYSEQIKTVYQKEINALVSVADSLDDRIDVIVDALFKCEGKVVFTGVGKSGHIGAKIASTFSSLGTPAFFLHPTEAKHGDLGMLDEKDVVVLLSRSGQTEEIINLLPYIKSRGITTIGITGSNDSVLSRECDLVYCFIEIEEATRYGLAPTSSTTALLVMGDALAAVLADKNGFRKEEFAALHPGGTLGECV